MDFDIRAKLKERFESTNYEIILKKSLVRYTTGYEFDQGLKEGRDLVDLIMYRNFWVYDRDRPI